MTLNVLIVDDSRFFRRRVTEMLSIDPSIKVIGEAANGEEAVDLAFRLKPDVITMDVEMPVMDGITATRRILAINYIPILMFSSLTNEGAKYTFDSLEAGAVDYLPKKFEEFANNLQEAGSKLCEKIRCVAAAKRKPPTTSPSTSREGVSADKKPISSRPAARPSSTFHQANRTAPAAKQHEEPAIKRGAIKIVAIGTSTGGPVALQKLLTALPEDFSAALLLVQHMPSSFTGPFADRLNTMSKITVREAKDGDLIKPGLALLAPGGQQMQVKKSGDRAYVHIFPAAPGQNYKPCIDITFNSLAETPIGKTLAIILTGMGSDGCQGVLSLKNKGAQVWVQDEETSVVYGMPASVVEAGGADFIYSIDEIAKYLAEKV